MVTNEREWLEWLSGWWRAGTKNDRIETFEVFEAAWGTWEFEKSFGIETLEKYNL